MAESTMVEQEVLDLLAEAALVKVQVVARFERSGAAVGAGAATGLATTAEMDTAARPRRVER